MPPPPLKTWLSHAWIPLGLFALAALMLAPALSTGYWGEDTYYSTIIRGGYVLNGDSFLSALIAYEKHNFHIGRFYPLTPLIITTVFTTIGDVLTYKLYLAGVTVLDLALFVLWLRKVGPGRGFAGFAGCMAVGLFQMRVYVDPLLGYYGQIQWMTAAVLASLILLERYLETRRAGWLVGAVLAYLLAALTYEVSYTLVVLHLWRVMRLRPRWVDRIRIALPFGLVIFACAGMSVLMRKWYPNNLYLQGPRLDPAAVGKAFAEQSTAALPLAYFVGDPLGIFATVRSPAEFVRWILDPGVAVVAILALAVAYFALRRGRFEPVRSGYGMLAAAGLALATLPGVLIAISPYHQNYLTWGVGWISVLTQLFGVALVFATIGWAWVASAWLGGRFARGKCLAVATLVALGLGLNERANREVAACFSAPVGSPRNRAFAASHGASWHLPRLNIEAALDAGLLEDVPARANLQVTHQYPYWHDPMYGPMFYAKHTGKPLTVAAESSAPGYRIRDLCVDATTGYVVLSEQGAPGARPVRLFVRHPGLTREMFQVFDVEHNNRLEHLTEIRTGPGWGLYRLEARNPETIEVVGAEGKWRAFDEPRAVAEQDRRAIIR